MHVLVVCGARFENGNLVGLALGHADGTHNVWIATPREVPVLEVVDHLVEGERVTTLFEVDGGHAAPGPNLQIIVLADGTESVETEGAPEGRRVADLPRLSYTRGRPASHSEGFPERNFTCNRSRT